MNKPTSGMSRTTIVVILVLIVIVAVVTGLLATGHLRIRIGNATSSALKEKIVHASLEIQDFSMAVNHLTKTVFAPTSSNNVVSNGAIMATSSGLSKTR